MNTYRVTEDGMVTASTDLATPSDDVPSFVALSDPVTPDGRAAQLAHSIATGGLQWPKLAAAQRALSGVDPDPELGAELAQPDGFITADKMYQEAVVKNIGVARTERPDHAGA